mmetsp:Transcript_22359/g.54632  ORF Transcript_22359/g.54632 Transcript_22359/m.54632 type:complete len:80 (+) Transcript_22359:701-940(+)
MSQTRVPSSKEIKNLLHRVTELLDAGLQNLLGEKLVVIQKFVKAMQFSQSNLAAEVGETASNGLEKYELSLNSRSLTRK